MNEDFLDFIRLLNRHKVEFILVGGYAYMFNVEARFTGDIDFWVRPTRDNLERLQAAAFEFIGVKFNVDDVMGLLQTSRLGFQLAGVKPNLIEVLLRVSGLEYDRTATRAKPTVDDGVPFLVIHPHDQIRNKRVSNREKDQADIKNLVKLYGEPPEENQS
jgi:hypothetical protein